MRNSEHKRKQFIALLFAIILRFGEIPRLALAEGIDFVVEDEDWKCYSTDNPSYNAEQGYGKHNFDGELTVVDCLTGYATVKCCYCEQTTDTEITPQSHILTEHNGSSATCTQNGCKPYWTCDVCGKVFSGPDGTEDFECTLSDLVIPATNVHTRGTQTRENVVEPTCSEGGSYDLVTRCAECTEVIESQHILTDPVSTNHTAGEPAMENPVEGTCSSAGGYDLVTRCQDCQEILSSQHIDTGINADNHTAGDPAPENQVDGTCSNAGGYDLVTRCQDCQEILSSQHIDTGINEDNHTADEPAMENPVEGTCSNAGSYDLVIRCKDCEEIISSQHIDTGINAANHTADEPAMENPVDGTCSNAGGYDLVTRCKDCKEIISSQHIETDINAENHTAGDQKPENVNEADCLNGGSYDLVTRCKDCQEILASEHITTDIDPEKHDWGDWSVISEVGGIRISRRVCNREASHVEEKQETIIVQTQQEDSQTPQDPQQETQGQQSAGTNETEGNTGANVKPQNPKVKAQNPGADLFGTNAGEDTISMSDYGVLLNDDALDKTELFVSHRRIISEDLSDAPSSDAVVFEKALPVGETAGKENVYPMIWIEQSNQIGMTENLQSDSSAIEIVGEDFAEQSERFDRTKEVLFSGDIDAFVENSGYTTVVEGDAEGVMFTDGNGDAAVNHAGETTVTTDDIAKVSVAGGSGDAVVDHRDHATVIAGDAARMTTVAAGNADLANYQTGETSITAGSPTIETLVGGDAGGSATMLNGTPEDITITDGTGSYISGDATVTAGGEEFYSAKIKEENDTTSVGWKRKEDTLAAGNETGEQVLYSGLNSNSNVTLTGGAGKDTLLAGAGDKIWSGAGNNVILLDDDETKGANISSATGKDTTAGFESGFDNRDDQIAFDAGISTLSSENNKSDDATIQAGNGNDTIIAGAASNQLRGGSEEDTIIDVKGNNQLWGVSGKDTLVARSGENAYFYGRGEGRDVIDAYGAEEKVLYFYNTTLNDQAKKAREGTFVMTTMTSGEMLTIQNNSNGTAFVFQGQSFHKNNSNLEKWINGK